MQLASMNTYIGDVPGLGRGVFAAHDMQRGAVIEVCPVIVMPPEQVQYVDRTTLGAYYYTWGEDHQRAAIALGHGSLYNHSYTPNARYRKDFERDVLTFVCLTSVRQGEEIRVNYNGDPEDRAPLWFDVLEDVDTEPQLAISDRAS